jgi:hypothetical protein
MSLYRIFVSFSVICLFVTLGSPQTKAEEQGTNPLLEGLSIGVLGYADYSAGHLGASDGGKDYFNRFKLTRAYLNIKKKMTPWLGARITPDAHLDDHGDLKVRLKYLYAEFKFGSLGPLTHLKSEVGLGHMPWLDFEEHINPYRCQGTMAVERAGVFNSADLGLSLQGYLGEELKDAKKKTGNHKYAGRWGSWHIGVYNGPGYHAKENNQNKTIDGRLTLRPLPDLLPGLQLSYLAIYGEGNKENLNGSFPDYLVHVGMLSFEHPWLVLTAQAFYTKGNASGKWVDASGAALATLGFSGFAKIVIPGTSKKLAVFGRFDRFDADLDDKIADKTAYNMFIAGLAYKIWKGTKLLLDFEMTQFEDDFAGKKAIPSAGTNLASDLIVQTVLQIKY